MTTNETQYDVASCRKRNTIGWMHLTADSEALNMHPSIVQMVHASWGRMKNSIQFNWFCHLITDSEPFLAEDFADLLREKMSRAHRQLFVEILTEATDYWHAYSTLGRQAFLESEIKEPLEEHANEHIVLMTKNFMASSMNQTDQ
eukprot:4360817-Amphidinium_carterae.1